MKKGTCISVIALLISIAALATALAVFLKTKGCLLCGDSDDYDDYYDEDCECDDECTCCCDCTDTDDSAQYAQGDVENPDD